MFTKIDPQPGYSVVKLIETQTSKGGIILRQDNTGLSVLAEVISVGDDYSGYLNKDGGQLKAGDTVIIMPGRGETFSIGADTVIIIDNCFILSAYEEE